MPVKGVHKPENTAVGAQDCVHGAILPKLIPVSQLNIGKSMIIVIFQGSVKNVLVRQKVIAPVSLAAMTVTHENEFGVLFIGKYRSICEELIKLCVKTGHGAASFCQERIFGCHG